MKLHLFYKITIIGIIIRIFPTIYSTGIFHADEHYQVLEFVSYKKFNTPASDLTWEFPKKIRQWFHPFIYIQVVNFFELFGDFSPTFYTQVFRFISFLLSSLILILFCRLILYSEADEKEKLYAVLLLNFTWFLPIFSIRTSSEALSMLTFAGAYYLFIKGDPKRDILNAISVGLLFGAVFQFRYHLAFMIFFLCLWSLVYKKKSIKYLAITTSTFFVTLFLAAVLDKWGYGGWNFTPWNFYYENIATGYAAKVSSGPWWRYIYEVQKEAVPGLGLVIVLSFFYFWIKYFKSPLTWVTLSFFVFHSLTGHKELRYVFPIMIFLPLIVASALRDFEIKMKEASWVKYLYSFLFIFNLAYLSMTLFRPLEHSENFYAFYKKYENKPETLYHFHEWSPFNIIAAKVNYYQLSDQKIKRIKSLEDIEENTFSIFTRYGEHYLKIKKNEFCNELHPNYSEFYLKYLYGSKLFKKPIYALFECKRPSN